jgi:hypothetical protein
MNTVGGLTQSHSHDNEAAKAIHDNLADIRMRAASRSQGAKSSFELTVSQRDLMAGATRHPETGCFD